jgi:carbon monoxide dehydrogenase subunit G
VSSRHAHWGDRARRKPSTSVDVGDRIPVEAPPDAVWARLEDVDAVAQCLPGLVPGSLERVEGDRYHARLEHSAMGVTAHWDLRAVMTLVEADRRLDVLLEGDDPKLGLKMNGTAKIGVEPLEAGSALDYTGHVKVEGNLAGVGGPIIRGIVGDALDRFVADVSGRPEPPPRRGPVARFFSRLWARLRGRRAPAA